VQKGIAKERARRRGEPSGERQGVELLGRAERRSPSACSQKGAKMVGEGSGGLEKWPFHRRDEDVGGCGAIPD